MEEGKNNVGEETGRIYTVRLEGMEFFAFHGVLRKEREEGNDFVVNLEFDYSGRCAASDDVADAVDYGTVFRTVSEIMRKQARNLLETLADDISEHVMSAFPAIKRLEVEVRKKNPPVEGRCAWSSVRTNTVRK